jgi:hypothetical protein
MRLEQSIGKEVIVFCDGPGKTKAGLNLWKYRSWVRTPKAVPEKASETITTTGETLSS